LSASGFLERLDIGHIVRKFQSLAFLTILLLLIILAILLHQVFFVITIRFDICLNLLADSMKAALELDPLDLDGPSDV
jgi:hypothetical protein